MLQTSKRQHIISEYKKCISDPVYFIREYCYITNQLLGKIKFNLFPFQQKTLKELDKNRFNIILKARQMGISTLCAGHALHTILFQSDRKVLIIANKLQIATNLFEKVSLMYENLPQWLKLLRPIKTKNVKRLVLQNGSWIKAVPATKDAGRSQALSLLIIDQMAHIDQNLIRNIWAGSAYTLATGGGAILLSTPNGCVSGDTKIKIRNKITKQIKQICIQDLRQLTAQEVSENRRNYEDSLCKLVSLEILNRKQASLQLGCGSLENDYQVLTPNGWSNFDGIRQQQVDRYIKFTFQNGKILKCSLDHVLQLDNYNFAYAQNINIGDVLSQNNIIISKQIINQYIKVYDLTNVQINNIYYTNDIISHNCGNQFHEIWTKAQNGQNEFNTIKLHWSLHPDRDQAWRLQQNTMPNEKIARQECDCQFLTSGNTVIDSDILNQYSQQVQQPIKKLLSDTLWIWQYPIQNTQYILSADVARGDSRDYSAFHIFNVANMEQVAQFKGKIDTTKYGQLLVKFASLYNNALLVPQNNNIGWDTVKTIVQLQYENLYRQYKNHKSLNNQQILSDYIRDNRQSVPGFTTTRNKPLLINKLISIMNNKQIKINSIRLINQLYTFIQKNNGSAQAMVGKNDDLVMALVIGLWVRDVQLISGNMLVQTTQACLSGFHSTSYNQFEIDTTTQEYYGSQYFANTQQDYKSLVMQILHK